MRNLESIFILGLFLIVTIPGAIVKFLFLNGISILFFKRIQLKDALQEINLEYVLQFSNFLIGLLIFGVLLFVILM